MKRMIAWIPLTVAALVTVSSCTKDPIKNLSDEESRLYITNRDSSANFASYKTYSIADSVAVIENNSFSGDQATAADQQALAAVRAALESRGYVRVGRNQSPDLGVNVSRLYNTTTNVVDLNNYWNDYGGYYDPYYWGYGGYGYGYPSAYGLVQSTEAMLSVDILDLKNAPVSRTIRVIWNGLIRGSGVFGSDAMTSGIQALFAQSPYLKTVQ
ncbi:DUF4136 domain-containing protein [Flavisolibacter nicotianae]|uniref:DUF4136 domain-containing protein n=1 Tax=Flavisolibacter nicotianae TaxID=2364882 RepID=UPI000EB41DC3|nr:DUF4136 domain-containing protein [Flavisolibacter nicotianae]